MPTAGSTRAMSHPWTPTDSCTSGTAVCPVPATADPSASAYPGAVKEIIIRGGENITSAEVENALHALPGVAEAVAIGLPHPRLGEVVGAIVTMRSGHQATEEEIRRAVGPALGRRAIPEYVMIWDGTLRGLAVRGSEGNRLRALQHETSTGSWSRRT